MENSVQRGYNKGPVGRTSVLRAATSLPEPRGDRCLEDAHGLFLVTESLIRAEKHHH